MKLLGVTVHEEKPCIILPLMKTDLKKHLKQNVLVRLNYEPRQDWKHAVLSWRIMKFFPEYIWKWSSIILFGSCSWHGISGSNKYCSSWPGCQELHVSNHTSGWYCCGNLGCTAVKYLSFCFSSGWTRTWFSKLLTLVFQEMWKIKSTTKLKILQWSYLWGGWAQNHWQIGSSQPKVMWYEHKKMKLSI